MMVAVTSDVSKRFRGNAMLILDMLSKFRPTNFPVIESFHAAWCALVSPGGASVVTSNTMPHRIDQQFIVIFDIFRPDFEMQ